MQGEQQWGAMGSNANVRHNIARQINQSISKRWEGVLMVTAGGALSGGKGCINEE